MKRRSVGSSSKPLLRLSTRKIVGCTFVIALSLVTLTLIWVTSHLGQEQLALHHDPFELKKHSPVPLNISADGICDVPPGQGEEGPAGIRGLYKIQRALRKNEDAFARNPPPSVLPRILCMVYTHSNRHDVLTYITQTYATHCDGFFAASNLTDQALGAWHLTHPGPESYENMWNKVLYMWLHVYEHHIMDFDW
jgi:hypothetical protein